MNKWFKALLKLIKSLLGIKSKTKYESYQETKPKFNDTTETKTDFTGPNDCTKEANLDIPDKLEGNSNDIVETCIQFLFTKLITGAGASAWSTFYTEVINQGNTELTKILAQLEDIQNKLTELTKLYVNGTYETYINQRTKYVTEMVNAQTYYMQQLQSVDSDSETAKKVLKEWSNSYVGGNSAMIQYQNFIDWILQVKVNNNTLYNIYDLYVYNTTPWEHQGYKYREQLRSLDCAAIANNAVLSMLYIKSRDDIDDSLKEIQINTISQKLKQYYDYYSAHAVEKHENKIICQIERTHFTMQKCLWTKDYVSHVWFPNDTEWDTENMESAWCMGWGDEAGTIPGNNCGKALYEAEINRIKAYYASKNITLWDILFNEMRLVMPSLTKDKTLYIPLSCSIHDVPDDKNRRTLYFGSAIKKGANDYTKERIGQVYCEHHGFLWLLFAFRRWNDLDTSRAWYFTTVESRDKDNWKD